jgi:hypothetical protein
LGYGWQAIFARLGYGWQAIFARLGFSRRQAYG